MLHTICGPVARVLAVAILLLAVGCGGSDPDGASDPTDSPSSTDPEVTDDVSLKVVDSGQGAVLSATNGSESKLLVLLPVGEPDQEKSSDGVTLNYVRSTSAGSGDEPDLYEAAALPPGSTERLDLSTVGTWTSKVAICLETVPWDDIASEAGGGTYRVQAREEGAAPTAACSPMAKIPAAS